MSLAIAWPVCLAKHLARRLCWADPFHFIHNKPWSSGEYVAAAAASVISNRLDSSWPCCDAISVAAAGL